jgi:hypothetical protein
MKSPVSSMRIAALRDSLRDSATDGVEQCGHLGKLFGGGEPALGQRGHPRANQSRGVGHHPDDRRPGGQPGLVVAGGDPGHHRDEHLLDRPTLGVGGRLGEFGDYRLAIGGLDGDDDELCLEHRLGDRRQPHRVRLGQIAGPLRHPLGNHQVGGSAACPEQPREECLPHAAATDERDSGHSCEPYRPGSRAS